METQKQRSSGRLTVKYAIKSAIPSAMTIIEDDFEEALMKIKRQPTHRKRSFTVRDCPFLSA